MNVNRGKPDLWKDDIARSVDMYNDWFINFAPEAYRNTRIKTTKDVELTLKATENDPLAQSGGEGEVTNARPAPCGSKKHQLEYKFV